jgi:3-methyladenine DNA glycosylase AlkD
MTTPEKIAGALPDMKKADGLLDKYLSERSKPLGKFKPENYFNNAKLKFLNVKTAHIGNVLKAVKKQKADERTIRKLADFLWKQKVFEKKSIAIGCYSLLDLGFEEFIPIVGGFDNWAHCDVFCGNISGPYFREHQDEIKKLIPFAKSKNPWDRRFACVSLITILRDPDAEHGEALHVLDLLVPDKERKIVGAAIDWMMREFLKKNYDDGLAYMKKWAGYCRKHSVLSRPNYVSLKKMSVICRTCQRAEGNNAGSVLVLQAVQ